MKHRAPIAIVLFVLGAGCTRTTHVEPSDDDSTTEGALSNLVSGGDEHTCAIINANEVACFGKGTRLGYGDGGTTLGDDEPASDRPGVVNIGGTVARLDAGSIHTCTITNSGAVVCFGENDDGQLGLGHQDTIGDDEDPADEGPLVLNPMSDISAGGAHTCAVSGDKEVYCWGRNEFGQLGIATTMTWGDDEDLDRLPPVDLSELATQVSAGGEHSCAVVLNGDVYCWGKQENGRLGYGRDYPEDVGDNEMPSEVGPVNTGTPLSQVSAGDTHTCALTTNGNVMCWGDGSQGALGYGNLNNTGDSNSPADVGIVSLGETATAVAAGGTHTCALLVSGQVRCWGSNQYGQLGTGNPETVGDNEVPSDVPPIDLGGTATGITCGTNHTCALLDDGTLRCFGRGGGGQLGYGTPANIGKEDVPTTWGPVPL